MPLYGQGGGPGIPAGAPGQILGTDNEGKPAWVDAGGKTLFRGAWASLATLKVESFASGSLPSDFAAVGQAGKVSMSGTLIGTNPPPGTFVRVANVQSGTAGVQTTVPNGVSRLRWWWILAAGTQQPQYSRLQFVRNGGAEVVTLGTVGPTWVQASADVAPGDVVAWQLYDYLSWGGDARVGYIEHLGIGSAAPYMLGEFVTHGGQMWKSRVDNNSQEPSKTSTAWETALTLPSPSGTTAQRPAPAAAGKGFPYFDETLNKPIWSDGTAWRDATGTVV